MMRAVRLFLSDSRNSKPAIVAAMHQSEPNGFWFEQDGSEIIAEWRNEQKLAAAVRRAMDRFSYKEVGMRSHKLTDWPAFRVSRCRSVNEFQKLYDTVWIQSLNDKELFFQASVMPRGEDEISLTLLLNSSRFEADAGRRLLRLHEACKQWQHVPFSAPS